MAKDTLTSCFTLDALMHAATKCASSAAWKRKAQAFLANRPTECSKLRAEILSGTYRPRECERFHIIERGKPRDVLPLDFRDRVAQRCFADQVLCEAVNRVVSPFSSACIKGRGLDYAYACVRSILEAAPPDGWAVQFDFASYFTTIDKRRAASALSSNMDAALSRLFLTFVGGDGIGLELGSHVCQLVASAYPAPLDAAVSSLPRCVGYHRYMDDGIAVFIDKRSAREGMRVIESEAAKLGLSLKASKTYANSLHSPLSFCKMRFSKTERGVFASLQKRQTRRSVRHAKKARRIVGECAELDASFLGYVNRGDADLSRLMEMTR